VIRDDDDSNNNKMMKVTKGWRKLNNEELHKRYMNLRGTRTAQWYTAELRAGRSRVRVTTGGWEFIS
jgi:hypothetical protein